MTSGDVRLRITTASGTIAVDVHADRAPLTSAYVLDLVDRGAFVGSFIYRSTTLHDPSRGSLVQGGPWAPLFCADVDAPIPDGIGMLDEFETSKQTGLLHRRGTVSLARDLLNTGLVIPEFFVCLDDYPELDADGRTEPDARGFPAFGTVVDGLDVAESIASQPIEGVATIDHLSGEILTDPVPITVRRCDTERTEPPD